MILSMSNKERLMSPMERVRNNKWTHLTFLLMLKSNGYHSPYSSSEVQSFHQQNARLDSFLIVREGCESSDCGGFMALLIYIMTSKSNQVPRIIPTGHSFLKSLGHSVFHRHVFILSTMAEIMRLPANYIPWFLSNGPELSQYFNLIFQ